MFPSPLIAAPMAGGPTTPALVEAAHAADSWGFLAGGNLSAAALADRMTDLRRTNIPFGVNLFVPSATRVDPRRFDDYRARLAAEFPDVPRTARFDDDDWHDKLALLADVPVASFTFGLPPADVITTLQRNGTRVLVTVTTVDEALHAQDADGLIVQGASAGGHSGAWDLRAPAPTVTTRELVAAIAAVTAQPITAAGGVTNSSDVADLLAAGATSVQVGTVLLRTPEAGTSAVHRAALTDHRFTGTVLTRAFTGRWARTLRNAFTDRYGELAPPGYPEIHRLTQGIRAAATTRRNPEHVHLWAGTGFRSATAEPAADVLRSLARQI